MQGSMKTEVHRLTESLEQQNTPALARLPARGVKRGKSSRRTNKSVYFTVKLAFSLTPPG